MAAVASPRPSLVHMRTLLALALLSTTLTTSCITAFTPPAFGLGSGYSSHQYHAVRCFSSELHSSKAADLEALRVPELKELLRSRGLKVSGRKAELVGRLLEGGDAEGSPSSSASAEATSDASTEAFAPARPNVVAPALSAATLEAPKEEKAEAAPLAAEASSDMAVEKDWPVEENFVKDSDRVEPQLRPDQARPTSKLVPNVVAPALSVAAPEAPKLEKAEAAPVNVVAPALSVATLEAPKAEKAEAAPAAAEASSDMDVEKDWPVEENFVKDSDRVEPGRYNDTPNSIAIPFLPRPAALDGSHAGDYGFDPLGFSKKLDFYAMQESEVRHARLAMLAAIGWPMSELLAPSGMLQNGCAPSVLNGVNPLSFLAIVGAIGAAGYFESKTSLRPSQSTPMGKLHEKDMSAVWKYGVAGDYNFDPLNWYSSCGDDYKGRKGLRDVELSHGRVAMLGITYFAAWEALTHHPIVENNMLFHPNALFPALVLGATAWQQIYEVGPLTDYPIEIKYTNEGEMKLKRVQNGIAGAISKVTEKGSKSKAQMDALDDKFDIYAAPGKFMTAVRSLSEMES